MTTADLAEALAAKGLEIDKRKIHLDEPIKAIGEFTVPVRLFRDVTAQLKVHVVKQDALVNHRDTRTRDARRFLAGLTKRSLCVFVTPCLCG